MLTVWLPSSYLFTFAGAKSKKQELAIWKSATAGSVWGEGRTREKESSGGGGAEGPAASAAAEGNKNEPLSDK